MGTINYGTSYYFNNAKNNREWEKDITIGLKPTSNYSDEDSGYTEWLEQEKSENEDFEYERYDYDYEEDNFRRDEVTYFIESGNTPDHYKISLESGYYEGFYLNIENDIPWVFDDSKEKREYQKDITVLKEFLLKLINEYGLVVVYPGWCTGYADKNESVKEISEFIRNLRQEVKSVDTWRVYEKKRKAKEVSD